MSQAGKARRIAWQYHHAITTSEGWLCLCGEPDTNWPMLPAGSDPTSQPWARWNAHFSAKCAEIGKNFHAQ